MVRLSEKNEEIKGMCYFKLLTRLIEKKSEARRDKGDSKIINKIFIIHFIVYLHPIPWDDVTFKILQPQGG